MHQEDDEYDSDDDYDYDYDHSQNSFDYQYKKFYFKFDPTVWDTWGKWLQDALDDIVESSPNLWYVQGFPFKSIPVSSYFSNTGKGNTFQYLGNNYHGVEVWKTKYLINKPLDILYKKHLQSNVVYFLNQPTYYKGMFDILN